MAIKAIILNKEELDDWMWQKVQIDGHTLSAIKGPPLDGMVYEEDGDPVINDINHGWRVDQTGEIFKILYGVKHHVSAHPENTKDRQDSRSKK